MGSRAGNSLRSTPPPLQRVTCAAHVSKVAEAFSSGVVQRERRSEPARQEYLGQEDPRTPWLPSPPASTEQADSTPWSSRPPRTPCELPIARATSPSSHTSTCPTTY